jgi:hypothetical protein
MTERRRGENEVFPEEIEIEEEEDVCRVCKHRESQCVCPDGDLEYDRMIDDWLTGDRELSSRIVRHRMALKFRDR